MIEALVARNIYHSNVVQLQTFAREICFIEDEDEFHTMLNFYHDLGFIVRHQSTVVLNAQWLIGLFRHLITIPRFEEVVSTRYFILGQVFFSTANAYANNSAYIQ